MSSEFQGSPASPWSQGMKIQSLQGDLPDRLRMEKTVKPSGAVLEISTNLHGTPRTPPSHRSKKKNMIFLVIPYRDPKKNKKKIQDVMEH